MSIRIILFFLITLISFNLFAQKKKVNYRKLDKAASEKQIVELHDGVLLVRLFHKQNHINALRKAKKYKQAEKLERKQKERNIRIIYSFKNYYNFSKVYFFFSEQSEFIPNNIEKVDFLNDSLEVDSSIKVETDFIYTTEFGVTEADTRVYSSEQYYENGEKKMKYYSGSGITLTALVFKDKNFIQLREPFPYYVREGKNSPFKRSIEKMVELTNEKLNEYYKKVTK